MGLIMSLKIPGTNYQYTLYNIPGTNYQYTLYNIPGTNYQYTLYNIPGFCKEKVGAKKNIITV